jgi:hypothetical protein
MLTSLLMFWALYGDAVEYFKFLEKEKSVEAIAFLFWDGVSWQIKNDQFVETSQSLYLIWITDFVISNVQLHQTSELWELWQWLNSIILKWKLKKVVKSGDTLNFCDFILT